MERKDFFSGVKVHTKTEPLHNLVLARLKVENNERKWLCINTFIHMNKNRFGLMIVSEDNLEIGWKEDWEGADYETSFTSNNSNPDPNIRFYQWLQSYESISKKEFSELPEYKQMNYRREFEKFCQSRS